MQASECHYCTPRENFGPYMEVEVWCINSSVPEVITEFEVDDDYPSAYVDIKAVAAYIDRHGGMRSQS